VSKLRVKLIALMPPTSPGVTQKTTPMLLIDVMPTIALFPTASAALMALKFLDNSSLKRPHKWLS